MQRIQTLIVREYNTFTMRVIHDILGYHFKFIFGNFLPISFYALTNGLLRLNFSIVNLFFL